MSEIIIESGVGRLSATIDVPECPRAALVLAHGAGADHRHRHMVALSEAFCGAGLVVLRFNFPFKEAGRNRVDSKAVSVSAITDAVEVIREAYALPLIIGGHSFGGRMATHAVAGGQVTCDGMILCSFPLHPAGKPGIERAEHLPAVEAPMLFLSGTRDALADRDLMSGAIARLETHHQLHWLDTADHSFKVSKRSRNSDMTAYQEAGAVAAAFVERITG